MAGWDEVLQDEDPDLGGVGWGEVIEEDERAAGQQGNWDNIVAEEAMDGDPEPVGWGDIVAEMSDGGESCASAPGQGPEDHAIVPADNGHLAVARADPLASTVATLEEVRLQLAGGIGEDRLALGQCVCKIGTLPFDMTFRGGAVFDKQSWDIATMLVQAEHTQTLEKIRMDTGTSSHSKVSELKTLLGVAVVEAERAALVQLLATITERVLSAGGKCLTLTIRYRYDETPLKMRSMVKLAVDAGADCGDASTSRTAPFADAGMTKLVQHEIRGGALFFVQGSYEVITFALPAYLRTVDRTTAEVYWRLAQMSELQVGAVADRFQRLQRVAITDSDAAISKAERAIARAEGGQPNLHLTCDIHRASAIAKRAADFTPGEVSGLIQLALSLSSASACRSFREVLRRVIADRLQIRQGSAGPAAEKHRQSVLDLFCPVLPGRGSSLVRRRTVSALANGDYSQSHCVQHFCNGCCANEEEAKRRVTRSLCSAFTRRACPVFPRSRWTKADATLRWVGLLAVVHDLLRVVYTTWALQFGAHIRPRASMGEGAGAGPSAIVDAAGGEGALVDEPTGEQPPVLPPGATDLDRARRCSLGDGGGACGS